MKGFFKEFLKRGLLFAWGGPTVVAFVWLYLDGSGELAELSVGEAVLGIYSSTVLAFVAAGITAIYQLEQLPKPIAGLIHLAVLYADYLTVYLLNGWIKAEVVAVFTLLFALGFCLIWAGVYLAVHRNVAKMNKLVENSRK